MSIGKNADTPLEAAADDYVECLRKLYDVADYLAVNVSSPNTARLREFKRRSRSAESSNRWSRSGRDSKRNTAGAYPCS